MSLFTTLLEMAAPTVGRKYQHIEDLVVTNGSHGGLHAVERMKHMVDNYSSIELKWDGMPVVYWGRDEKGVFRMIPKNAWAYLKSGKTQTSSGAPTVMNGPNDVYAFVMGTGNADPNDKSRVQFAKQFASMWPYFEKISPKQGFLEGGLLFYPGTKPDGQSAMPVLNKKTGTYDFQPNITKFHVPVKSDLGSKIAKAKIMVAATGYYATLGSTDEQRYPNASDLSTSAAIVQGTTYVEEMPGVDTSYIDKVENFISSNAQLIDNYLAPKKGLSKPGGILYTYLNSHLRTKGLVRDFPQWAQANLSEGQAQGMLSDKKGYQAVLGAVEGLTNAKMQLIKSLSLGLHGGIMQTNPEGYVQAHPEINFKYPLPGQFLKLIDQQNWAPKKISETITEANNTKVDAVVGWGRGMGHKGHMLLAQAVIIEAQRLKATPFFFVSQTMGKEDPLTPEEKLFIYKKVFPKQAGIFHSGDTLANVLTQVGQKYKNVVLVLGEDQVQPFQWLVKPDKSGNVPYQSYGLNSLQIISRQQVNDPAQSEEGPRATPMREILKNPNATEEEQFQYWREAMPDALSDAEVLEFMNRAKTRLNAPKKVKEPKQKAVKKIKDKPLKESVIDIVRNAKPLLKEASLEKKMQFLKLMKVALKENYEERTKLIHKLADTGKYDERINEEPQEVQAVPNEDPDSGEEWDYYYKGIKIEPGQDLHTQIKDQHMRMKNPAYDAMRNAFDNPIKPGPPIPQNKWPENKPGQDRVVPDYSNPSGPDYTKPKQFIMNPSTGQPYKLKDLVPSDPDILEDYLEEK